MMQKYRVILHTYTACYTGDSVEANNKADAYFKGYKMLQEIATRGDFISKTSRWVDVEEMDNGNK